MHSLNCRILLDSSFPMNNQHTPDFGGAFLENEMKNETTMAPSCAMAELARPEHAEREVKSKHASVDALDKIAALSGISEWSYPGQVVRDVLFLVRDVIGSEDPVKMMKLRLEEADMSPDLIRIITG